MHDTRDYTSPVHSHAIADERGRGARARSACEERGRGAKAGTERGRLDLRDAGRLRRADGCHAARPRHGSRSANSRPLPGLQQTGFATVRWRPAPPICCARHGERRQRGALGAPRARSAARCATSTQWRRRVARRRVAQAWIRSQDRPRSAWRVARNPATPSRLPPWAPRTAPGTGGRRGRPAQAARRGYRAPRSGRARRPGSGRRAGSSRAGGRSRWSCGPP